MPEVELEDVNSSNILQYGYNRKVQTLRVIFRNGLGYDYPLVPERAWERFQAADSKGSFLNKEIKPLYVHRKLRDSELKDTRVIQPDAKLPTLEDLAKIYEDGGDPHEHMARVMYAVPDDEDVTDAQRVKAKEHILTLSYGGKDKDASKDDDQDSRRDES